MESRRALCWCAALYPFVFCATKLMFPDILTNCISFPSLRDKSVRKHLKTTTWLRIKTLVCQTPSALPPRRCWIALLRRAWSKFFQLLHHICCSAPQRLYSKHGSKPQTQTLSLWNYCECKNNSGGVMWDSWDFQQLLLFSNGLQPPHTASSSDGVIWLKTGLEAEAKPVCILAGGRPTTNVSICLSSHVSKARLTETLLGRRVRSSMTRRTPIGVSVTPQQCSAESHRLPPPSTSLWHAFKNAAAASSICYCQPHNSLGEYINSWELNLWPRDYWMIHSIKLLPAKPAQRQDYYIMCHLVACRWFQCIDHRCCWLFSIQYVESFMWFGAILACLWEFVHHCCETLVPKKCTDVILKGFLSLYNMFLCIIGLF